MAIHSLRSRFSVKLNNVAGPIFIILSSYHRSNSLNDCEFSRNIYGLSHSSDSMKVVNFGWLSGSVMAIDQNNSSDFQVWRCTGPISAVAEACDLQRGLPSCLESHRQIQGPSTRKLWSTTSLSTHQRYIRRREALRTA